MPWSGPRSMPRASSSSARRACSSASSSVMVMKAFRRGCSAWMAAQRFAREFDRRDFDAREVSPRLEIVCVIRRGAKDGGSERVMAGSIGSRSVLEAAGGSSAPATSRAGEMRVTCVLPEYRVCGLLQGLSSRSSRITISESVRLPRNRFAVRLWIAAKGVRECACAASCGEAADVGGARATVTGSIFRAGGRVSGACRAGASGPGARRALPTCGIPERMLEALDDYEGEPSTRGCRWKFRQARRRGFTGCVNDLL